MPNREISENLCAPLAQVMEVSTLDRRLRVQLMNSDSALTIARAVRDSGLTWVWVEGFSQAGKSVFATRLAVALGWTRMVHLDHMTLPMDRQPDSTRYADHLDRDRVLSAVRSPEPVVVEGVCLQDVVEKMRPDPAVRVYVARVSSPTRGSLIWHDGIELLESEGPTDHVNWLVLDIVAYHRRTKPHARAEHVLLRVECEPETKGE
jgi:hypothetical protein